MDKKIIFYGPEIEEYELHQYKSPVSINNTDINKTVVSKKFLFDKIFLNISLITKIIEKLGLYAYYFHKWVYIKDILIRLNVYILW